MRCMHKKGNAGAHSREKEQNCGALQKTFFRMYLKDRSRDSGAKSALKRAINAGGTFTRTEK